RGRSCFRSARPTKTGGYAYQAQPNSELRRTPAGDFAPWTSPRGQCTCGLPGVDRQLALVSSATQPAEWSAGSSDQSLTQATLVCPELIQSCDRSPDSDSAPRALADDGVRAT